MLAKLEVFDRLFFMKTVSIALIALLTSVTQADEHLFFHEETRTHIVVVDSEEQGIFHIDIFAGKDSTLPERISRQDFLTASLRDEALSDLLKSYQLTHLSMTIPVEPRTPASASNVVWTATESWDWDWEKKYADWLVNEVDENFLLKHNIPVDCADVVFALRWIFSRMHHLPAAHHLPGGLSLLTHESGKPEWASFAPASDWWQDKKFMASLAYLLKNTYTHSLVKDSYPIQIDPAPVSGGAFMLDLHSPQTGHTNLIHFARYGDPTDATWIKWIYSPSGRPFLGKLNSQFGIYRSKYPDKSKQEGYLRHRWPVNENGQWKLLEREKMPYFSEEQYDSANFAGEKVFAKAVFTRLHKTTPDPKAQYSNTLNDAITRIKVRVDLVEQGFAACAPNRCAVDSEEYDRWSTPSRDKAIADAFEAALRVLRENYQEVLPVWQSREKEVIVTIQGKDLDLSFLNWVFTDAKVSSDPNDKISKRWALE